jgi:hypothetical protein
MATFNTKYILPGDSKNKIITKVNHNFNQVHFNAIGEQGPNGAIGATGIIGQAGLDGDRGTTGDRASNWYFSPSQPSASISQPGDIWIDIGNTGGQDVYKYSSATGGWINTGETLETTGIFASLSQISGPGGSTEDNAVLINSSPGDKYLTLSDLSGTTGDVNPNFAKLLISTVSNTYSPILGIDKTFFDRSNIGGFYWKNSSTSDYDLVWKNPGFSRYAAKSITLGVTGNIDSFPAGSNNIKSQSYIGITASSSQIISSGNLSVNSSNLQLSSAIFGADFTSGPVIIGPTGFSHRITSAYGTSGLINANSTGSKGMRIGLSNTAGYGTTSGYGSALQLGRDSNSASAHRGQSFEVRSNGDSFQIGSSNFSSNTSGVTGGNLTRYTQTISTPFTSTFVRSGVTYYHVPVTPSEDIVIIKPSAIAVSVVSNYRKGRFYLTVGNNYSWLNLSLYKYRTIEFLVEDTTRSFGGIRVNINGSSNYNLVEIPDNYSSGMNPGALGCKRIRLTFINGNSSLFYEAFGNNDTSAGTAGGVDGNNANIAGWVSYNSVVTVPGGGGGVII